jgi:hypothetical protein
MVVWRPEPHLISLADGVWQVLAGEAANQLRGAAGIAAILKRLIFGRRPMCRVCCSPCRCSRQTPRRFKWSACDAHAALGGPFGLAMVWEREGREHRAIFCYMVLMFRLSRLRYLHFTYLFDLHTLIYPYYDGIMASFLGRYVLVIPEFPSKWNFFLYVSGTRKYIPKSLVPLKVSHSGSPNQAKSTQMDQK